MFIIPKGAWSAPQQIANNNWSGEFPYAPQVEFKMKHDGEKLFVTFDVHEQYTKADITEDNGQVWTDSCVEFFVSFDDRGYYNFEFTCIGKLLLAFRKTKPEPTYASVEVLSSIVRNSSLGTANFTERVGENHWTLEVEIPRTAFFEHDFANLSGVEATANVYKCGDNLTKPHFLSWKPISTDTPNFHVPQYFGAIKFE